MKGLVISGGGADGPHTLGVLEGLGNPKYDYANGVSTGALQVMMYQMGMQKELLQSYMVFNKDIYNKSCLNKKGSFSPIKLLARGFIALLTGKKSIGEHYNLKKRIDSRLTDEVLNNANLLGVKTEVGVHFDEDGCVRWISNKTATNEEYRYAVWASTAVPLIMSCPEIEGQTVSDGGISEGVGLAQAVKSGCTEIDVFMHSAKTTKFYEAVKYYGLEDCKKDHVYHKPSYDRRYGKITNIIKKVFTIFFGVYVDSDLSSLLLGLFIAKEKGCKVTIHWMPREYYKNAFTFSKKKSEKLYNFGKLYAKHITYKDVYDYGK